MAAGVLARAQRTEQHATTPMARMPLTPHHHTLRSAAASARSSTAVAPPVGSGAPEVGAVEAEGVAEAGGVGESAERISAGTGTFSTGARWPSLLR